MKRTATFIRPFIILMWMLMVMACSPRQQLAVMDCADSLMNTRPDSALTLLNTLLADTNAMSKGDMMRFHLLRTNAQNKCDTVFTARHAALMHRVCDYYDHRSSKREANNKMLAHYLLGRCYDDMGEAPAALQEFHNAADAADTTRVDCDYSTLLRVHAQTANIFYLENLFEYQLSELEKVVSFAQRLGDVSTELWAYENKAGAYELTGRSDEALLILQTVHKRFLQCGLRKAAARSLGVANGIKVNDKHYDGLAASFQEYEQHSGFFDSDGNIVSGNELYYVHKGRYYNGTNKSDSALFLFHKCLNTSKSLENRLAAAQEITGIYNQKNGPSDSIAKYALLASYLDDSLRINMRTIALSRQEGMYNYSRLRQETDALRIKNEQSDRQKQKWFFFTVISAIILSFVIFRWRSKIKSMKKEKEKKEKELHRLRNAYQSMLTLHEQTLSELSLTQNELEKSKGQLLGRDEVMVEKERLLVEMTDEIKSMKQQIFDLRKELNVKADDDRILEIDKEIGQMETLDRINSCLKANPPIPFRKAEIFCMRTEMRRINPVFYEKLVIEHQLPLSKYDICILYRLRVKPAHIAILLGMGRSTITTERHRIYEHIFSKKDEGEEFMSFINSIH